MLLSACTDGITYMPVQTDSFLFKAAHAWQFPAYVICLGSSYLQRMLVRLPSLQASVRSCPGFEDYCRYLPDTVSHTAPHCNSCLMCCHCFHYPPQVGHELDHCKVQVCAAIGLLLAAHRTVFAALQPTECCVCCLQPNQVYPRLTGEDAVSTVSTLRSILFTCLYLATKVADQVGILSRALQMQELQAPTIHLHVRTYFLQGNKSRVSWLPSSTRLTFVGYFADSLLLLELVSFGPVVVRRSTPWGCCASS